MFVNDVSDVSDVNDDCAAVEGEWKADRLGALWYLCPSKAIKTTYHNHPICSSMVTRNLNCTMSFHVITHSIIDLVCETAGWNVIAYPIVYDHHPHD